MKHLKSGKTLFLALAICLSSVSCRTDKPPKIEICTLDGFGGGDCILADGTRAYRSPSEMTNYWTTNQADMARFTAWCYDTSVQNVRPQLEYMNRDLAEMRQKRYFIWEPTSRVE